MKTERVRGVTLRLLDTEALAAKAQEQLGSGPLKVGFGPWAIGTSPARQTYVVCREGVGYNVTKDGSAPFPLFSDRPGFISVAPSYEANLSADELAEFVTDQEVDLADHVRVFGWRLEDNFWQMVGALTR